MRRVTSLRKWKWLRFWGADKPWSSSSVKFWINWRRWQWSQQTEDKPILLTEFKLEQAIWCESKNGLFTSFSLTCLTRLDSRKICQRVSLSPQSKTLPRSPSPTGPRGEVLLPVRYFIPPSWSGIRSRSLWGKNISPANQRGGEPVCPLQRAESSQG